MGNDPTGTTAHLLGHALRRERKSKGLRQDDVALAAGLGLRAVHDVEAGKKTAHFETWLKIMQALDLNARGHSTASTFRRQLRRLTSAYTPGALDRRQKHQTAKLEQHSLRRTACAGSSRAARHRRRQG